MDDRDGLMARLAPWLVFPCLLVGGIRLAVFGIGRGFHPLLVSILVSLGVAGILLVLERLMPYADEWAHSKGDIVTDATHTLISTLGVVEVIRIGLFMGAGFVGTSWLGDRAGLHLWPRDWPIIAQMCLALVIGEFGQYWIHRLSHETEILWRLHATHHSVPRLYWLNAGRFHPLDTIIQYGAQMVPLALLGISDSALGLFLLFTSIHGLHQHSNVKLHLGVLNWVFSMTELHRWHHSRKVSEANHNYGANLIVWDIVFGTRFLPKDRQPPTNVGLSDMPDFPQDFLGHLASPFRWKKVSGRPPLEPPD
jgi:sterol desaturase/sphingolipid hydroxylase (fatty acid hydroxylase superfamily)